MKRLAFYKEYYEITNRIYADRTIWSAKGREYAWRKGQILTSKTERRILVAAQYFVLLVTGISFAAGNNRFGMLGCILFFLCSFLTDFSIMKIEMLYHIFSRNDPYSNLLYQIFLGKADDFWRHIQCDTKKTVSGFVRIKRNKFVAKYRVVFRKKREDVTILISPFHIRIKSKTQNIVFHDSTATAAKMINDISEALKAL